jgi:hypothetical protein
VIPGCDNLPQIWVWPTLHPGYGTTTDQKNIYDNNDNKLGCLKLYCICFSVAVLNSYVPGLLQRLFKFYLVKVEVPRIVEQEIFVQIGVCLLAKLKQRLFFHLKIIFN